MQAIHTSYEHLQRSRFCENILSPSEPSQQIVPVAPADVDPAPAAWTMEPTSVQELLDMYVIENKMSGRVAGTSLWLTAAQRRSGEDFQVTEGQKYKLWLVARKNLPNLG